jgi:hypothetical protein
MTNEERDALLLKYDWIVFCESPFELEHLVDTQSKASGLAAWYVFLHCNYLESQ